MGGPERAGPRELRAREIIAGDLGRDAESTPKRAVPTLPGVR